MGNLHANVWNRREFVGGMALAGAGAYLGIDPGLAFADPPPETTTIRIRNWRPACWAPIYVAEPLLREEGFTDIQYVPGPGPKYPKMLKEGLVDISPEFVALGMSSIDKHNPPVKYLAGLHVGCYALVGSKRIRSVRDLKGKTVWAGSIENNGPHLFFSAIVAYVGLDPRKDINYAWVKKDKAMRMFHEGKIDAVMSFPPGPQQLRKQGVGRVLVDTNVDKPWSQYFCCMISGHSEFVKKNPIATRRALRAILKANDLVAQNPEQATYTLIDKGILSKNDFIPILDSLKEIPYDKWRDYNPEDTLRFYALRLREVGMIKSSPEEFIAQNTDWSFLNSLKSEMGMTW